MINTTYKYRTKLDQLKHKKAGIDEAVTALLTREKEIVEKGENVKKEVHTHTQQLIDELKRSEITVSTTGRGCSSTEETDTDKAERKGRETSQPA